MIKRKKKLCKNIDCGREDYIVGKGLCAWCYNDLMKKKMREKAREKKPKETDEVSEMDIFEEIWAERKHVSEIDGTPLLPKGHRMWHWQFSHLLPKSIYGKARLDKDNIVLMTWAQHQLWEFHPHKLREKEQWRWVFEKRERLKRQYHE